MKPSRWVILVVGVAVLIAMFLVLRPTSENPSASPSAASEPVDIPIDIVDGRAASSVPAVVDVPLGSPVTIDITSDTEGTVHLHGYEVYTEVTPGTPATMSFVADAPGRFVLQLHGEEAPQLTELQVS